MRIHRLQSVQTYGFHPQRSAVPGHPPRQIDFRGTLNHLDVRQLILFCLSFLTFGRHFVRKGDARPEKIRRKRVCASDTHDLRRESRFASRFFGGPSASREELEKWEFCM